MALIKCPNCGRDVSDKALSCPNCGNTFTNTQMAQAPIPQAPIQQAPIQQAPMAQAPIPQVPIQQVAPNIQNTYAPYNSGVIAEGYSGKITSNLVGAIIFFLWALAVVFSYLDLSFFDSANSNLELNFIFVTCLAAVFFIGLAAAGISSLILYPGYHIRVTTSDITGKIGTKKVNLPISSIVSVKSKSRKNLVLITINKKYKFLKLPNRDQIVNAINSVLSSRQQ